jgi:peroxiredoxin
MPLNIGDPAPNFTLADVLTGQTHNLADYKSKNVFLIFSGPSWCSPCKFEAPVLEALSQASTTQFFMISVSENEQSYKDAIQNFGLTFPCLYDPTNSVWSQYLIDGVPTVYVIDGEQKVCDFHVGIVTPADVLYSKLNDMLTHCEASEDPYLLDLSRWAAVATILFGVTQDGGGLALSGRKPVPIDPWGPPLVKMSIDKRDVLMNLAISEMTKSVSDVRTAGEIELAALRSAEASIRKLVARASLKPLELSAAYSPVKRT